MQSPVAGRRLFYLGVIMKKCHTAALYLSLCTTATLAHAEDATRLGKDLNPLGGEIKGNKDGSIPAWTEENVFPGWSAGKDAAKFYKYRDEKALFVIDAGNVDKHADKLAPGLLKLVKSYNMKLPVYPSHRTCQALDFFAENTRKNVSAAKINSDGWSLGGAILPGVPFPIPENGIQVIWNHLTRYQGAASEWKNLSIYLSPRPGSDSATKVRYDNYNSFPHATKGSNPIGSSPFMWGMYYAYQTPAALTGQAIMQNFFFDKPADTWYYFPAQRRVRRLPSYDYDTPNVGFEGVLIADSNAVLLGNPDRFNWKLLGKKEMYIAVNNFAFTDSTRKIDDVMKRDHIDASVLHYELRRVWAVEATVKQGMRHIAPKRTFYIDEDSWIAVGSEDYDAQGQMTRWKTSEQAPTPELGGQCNYVSYQVHDLQTGRYYADMLQFDGGTKKYFTETSDPKFKPRFYSAESLQRLGD